MIVKFLDKFGKLVKSITSIAYIPVDVEPVEGSGHLLSSGAGANISSNFAPNYTEKTYEANSYVMQDGVLYTNPNAIETAEDWNPEHWTQTTVAEMMAGAGGSTGYVQYDIDATYTNNKHTVTGISNRSVFVVSSYSHVDAPWKITIDNDCTDSILILKNNNYLDPSSIAVSRLNGDSLPLYGKLGQLIGGNVTIEDCGGSFDPTFNGINGYGTCDTVIVRICGNVALLSFLQES